MKSILKFIEDNKNKILLVITLFSIPFSFVLIWLTIKTAWIKSLALDQSTGLIGDTIGGITAPIFGFLSAVLIYYSFREQFKANEIQKNLLNRELERSILFKEYEHVKILLGEFKNLIKELKSTVILNAYTMETLTDYGLIRSYANNLGASIHFYEGSGSRIYILEKTDLITTVFYNIILKMKLYGRGISKDNNAIKEQDLYLLNALLFIEYKKMKSALDKFKEVNQCAKESEFLKSDLEKDEIKIALSWLTGIHEKSKAIVSYFENQNR